MKRKKRRFLERLLYSLAFDNVIINQINEFLENPDDDEIYQDEKLRKWARETAKGILDKKRR